MNSRNRPLLAISLFVLLVTVQSVASENRLSNHLSQNLQTIINKAIKEYNLPSLVLSYKLPNQPIKTLSAGYANLSTLKPISTQTLFAVGSITKSFTSTIILMLQQQGKLSLDEKITKFAKPGDQLYEWVQKYPFLKHVTLRQMLNHTSGVPAALNTPVFAKLFTKHPTKCYSNDFLMNHVVFKQKPYFKPGSGQYHYTNTDYMLVVAVISAVTHKSYHANFMALLKRVGYAPKSYYVSSDCRLLPAWVNTKLPQGYMPSNSGWPKTRMAILEKYTHVKIPGNNLIFYNVTPNTYPDTGMGISSGGLITTTANLVHWYDLLFHGALLDAKSIASLVKTVPTPYGFGYGLGVTVRSLPKLHDTAISHNGSMTGFKTNLIYLKKHDIILALATNSASNSIGLGTPLVNKIITMLIKKKTFDASDSTLDSRTKK